MDSITVKRAGDIDTPARQWLQNVLGRPLGDDERITFFVPTPHPVPPAADRRAAAERLNAVLDRAAESMRDVPDAEFEPAVDEAMEHVRRRSE